MSSLSVKVPAIPENRSEVVAARLSRKLAPLLGVRWSENPFDRTWVCDYSELTLAEIGRGAPLPRRSEAAALLDQLGEEESWRVVGRVVVSRSLAGKKNAPILPNEIASATLNKFGPDTKAAVVLVGGNRLFADVATAITAALTSHLRPETGPELAPQLRLAAWARLVHEVYAGQPALFAAVMQARAIARSLTSGWGRDIVPPDLTGSARCEAGAAELRGAEPNEDPFIPRAVPVVDETIRRLDLYPGSSDDQDVGLLLDGHVSRWNRHLLQIGVGREPGLVWVAEHDPGHRRVEVYHPWLAAVHAFVGETFPDKDLASQPIEHKIPAVPDAEALRASSTLEKRAVVLGIGAMLRYVRQYASFNDGVERATSETFAKLARLANELLGPHDSTTIETVAFEAMARARLHRERSPEEYDTAIADLRVALQVLDKAITSGDYPVGSAAEVISASCVAINTLRRERTGKHQADHEIEDLLHTWWHRYFDILEAGDWNDPASRADETVRWRQDKLKYYLHNYAGYLAGRTHDEKALRTAIDMFEQHILPSREPAWTIRKMFQPYRIALQVCSRAMSNLSDLLHESGRLDEANQMTISAHEKNGGIANDERTMRELLDPSEGYNENRLNTMLTLARVDVRRLERGLVTENADDVVNWTAELLDRGHDWIRSQGPHPKSTVRRKELDDLIGRIDTLRKTR